MSDDDELPGMIREHREILMACQSAQHKMAQTSDQTYMDFLCDQQVIATLHAVMSDAVEHFSQAMMSEGVHPMEAMLNATGMSIAMLLRVGFEAGKDFASITAQRDAALAEFAALLDPTLADLTGETFTDPTDAG